ncbi:Integrase, catalytic core [Cucumis melo var. makuwa]|uniref:Integrase, catalytic core n=1 Tax=Cucumis melo var. makuwa TaxID=1194695 RepID=A0A5A7UY76_CUCMM|nr:Integrase, catalytic core [Cucumis melo var. makuwa]TYJ95582.1 Integrase, catalytic core [Cucumis melo var. makuwa]
MANAVSLIGSSTTNFRENPCPPKFIINQIDESQSDGIAKATDGASSRSTETKTVNPKFDQWVTSDLLLLGWIYNSMTAEVAFQLMGFNTAKDLEEAIQDLFGVQSRGEEDFLRHTFQTTRKGNSKMEDYLRIMKTNAENLGQAGSPIPLRSLISQVLLGLDEVYNPNSQKNPGNIVQNATVNMVQNRVNNDARQSGNSYPQMVMVSMVVTPFITMAVLVMAEEEEINRHAKYVENTLRLLLILTVDSGATNHVTTDYSNLSNPSEYSGIEHVIVGNGNELQISCTGNSNLSDGKSSIKLENVLYVPDIKKNLISVSKLVQDNNVLEFYGDHCFVKDKDTGQTIMRGVLRDGLYHLIMRGVLRDGLYHLESVVVLADDDLKKSGSRKLQFEHINKNASTFLLSKMA